MVNMDHADIVRYYNSITRGILGYYSFCDNHKSLGAIVHGLKHSCALTLALKYKLRHRSKVFKKFGSFLREPRSGIQLFIPKTFVRTRKFLINPPVALSHINRVWNSKLTRSGLLRQCVICGTSPVEMHHVRNLKELRTRKHLDWFTQQMAAINRKQVPLCRDHHVGLHQKKVERFPKRRDSPLN